MIDFTASRELLSKVETLIVQLRDAVVELEGRELQSKQLQEENDKQLKELTTARTKTEEKIKELEHLQIKEKELLEKESLLEKEKQIIRDQKEELGIKDNALKEKSARLQRMLDAASV